MAKKKKNKKKLKKVKKAAPKKKAANRKAAARKAAATRRAAKRRRTSGKREEIPRVAFEPAGLGLRSGGQSGDLQGLSNRGGADSESVGELLEEGNAFEAEAVKGVEDVADEEEVHTHEVPVDDVPGEYEDEQ